MYAIIRAGGKQAKVEQGDVLDVERVKGDGAIVYTPLLVVQDDGTVISDRQVLSTVTVTAAAVAVVPSKALNLNESSAPQKSSSGV